MPPMGATQCTKLIGTAFYSHCACVWAMCRNGQQAKQTLRSHFSLCKADSVHIPRAGGDEYIVYHSDQVELQTVQLVALPAHYPHDKANPGFFSHGTPCTLIGPAFKTSHLQKNPRALDAFLKFDAVGAAQLLSGGSYHSTGGHHSTAATGGGVSLGKPVCKYAPRCYRTSTDHWRDYDHPGQHAPVPKPW